MHGLLILARIPEPHKGRDEAAYRNKEEEHGCRSAALCAAAVIQVVECPVIFGILRFAFEGCAWSD